MKEQNFKNHKQFVFGFHLVTLLSIVVLIVGSFVNLYQCPHESLLPATLLCLISLILGSLAWYSRTFALKAQDRAIRAEESLRYLVLTGKPLPSALRLGQIIALRFAPDEELPELVQKAASEKLSPDDIKKAIQQWRADRHRA